jgi:hypothetical protein
MNTSALPLIVAWFETAMPDGPAIGDPETTTWGDFASCFWYRREGEKDGPCFALARFQRESDGRHVRRVARNVLARTAIALDIETNKDTGEVPPGVSDIVARLMRLQLASVVSTTHSHDPASPRYRIVLPVTHELDAELPVAEAAAGMIGLEGVIDPSKANAASIFYMPSCPLDALDQHSNIVIPGAPIDAAWAIERGTELLTARRAEEDLIAARSFAEAKTSLSRAIAVGIEPATGLIAKLRAHLSMDQILRTHGYDRQRGRYRHPASSSGSFGAHVVILGGIDRVYSHNATDPLHRANLPEWCTVTALDVVDVVTILDFGGDRRRALADLASRFNLSTTEQRRQLSALIWRTIRRGDSQQAIQAAAFAEGQRLGLTRADVIAVAKWVAIGQGLAA